MRGVDLERFGEREKLRVDALVELGGARFGLARKVRPPDGADEESNIEVRRWYKSDGGEPPALDLTADHVTLGEALGMMDFEAAARLSGARFVTLKGPLARLERALAGFMLDLHTRAFGYTEVAPPLLVKDHAMFGTGQLPKFVDDQFTAARTVSREELLFQALERFDEEIERRKGAAQGIK